MTTPRTEILNSLTNEQLIRLVVTRAELSDLELELMLRLEAYVNLYGDYLETAH